MKIPGVLKWEYCIDFITRLCQRSRSNMSETDGIPGVRFVQRPGQQDNDMVAKIYRATPSSSNLSTVDSSIVSANAITSERLFFETIEQEWSTNGQEMKVLSNVFSVLKTAVWLFLLICSEQIKDSSNHPSPNFNDSLAFYIFLMLINVHKIVFGMKYNTSFCIVLCYLNKTLAFIRLKYRLNLLILISY